MEKRILGLYTDFRPPPEAKVYHPTLHEFKDPIRYIHSIREEAEKEGVIKIVPPRGAFNHKCVINPETYMIDSRYQKLCGIDMLCRDRMYFIKKLELFWSNFDVIFSWPYINDCYVDMKRLYELVQAEKGPSEVTKAHGWADIARTLGFMAYNGTNLRDIYNKWLQPFKESFLDLEKTNDKEDVILLDPKEENKPEDLAIENQQNGEITELPVDETDDEPPAKRLRKGRMMAGVRCRTTAVKNDITSKINGKCAHCMKLIADNEVEYLQCYSCSQEFHPKCVTLKQNKTLSPKWRCMPCLKKELKEYEFYFVDNESARTLTQFKAKADAFKKNYFKVSNHEEVLVDKVETEYWKNVADFEGRIEVEYGADLESKKLGSGFPRSTDEFKGVDADKRYQWARHPWNLNNLPVLQDSALSHVGSDISGMVVPWVYVGMCFSTFCWHVEDHWTYSMNYMHQGETKIWYGFGREYADKFEEVMKKISPDLFHQNPSMLNTMHNMLNPLILMEHGIPVKTVRQNAGEFVVTFPRAYHAGFNCGLNVAEAVNFAPYDWLAVGRQCIENYMNTSRCCVFAHDELIFNLANSTKNLSLGMLAAVYKELEDVYERECKFRRDLGENNIKQSEFCEFGNVPDDDRSCSICGTTLFVTGLEYKPKGAKKPMFGCSKHWRTLLKWHGTNDMIVRYSLTLQQIRSMKEAIVEKVHRGNGWRKKVSTALATRLSLREAESFMSTFHRQKLPSCEEVYQLSVAINNHSELESTATRLFAPKIKLRTETRIQRADDRISPQGILELVRKFKNTEIFNESMIERLDNRYRDYLKWTRRLNQLMGKERELSPFEYVQSLEKLLAEADVLNMKLDEVEELKVRIRDVNWKMKVENIINTYAKCQANGLLLQVRADVPLDEEFETVNMNELDDLRAYARVAAVQKRIPSAEKSLAELDRMRRDAVQRLSEVNEFLHASTNDSNFLRGFEEVFKFAEAKIPALDWLRADILTEFKEEVKRVEEIYEQFNKLSSGEPLKLASLYQLMRQTDKNRLLINPQELDDLEETRDSVLEFIEEIHRVIVKEGTYHSAVQCLFPRRDLVSMIEEATEKLYKQSRDDFSEEWPELKGILTVEEAKAMFPMYDNAETIRLLTEARRVNAELSVCRTCIDSPTCSKKLSDEERESTIQCFVCLQKQHTNCAIWSPALDRYPEGLYVCHRCCRSQRPTLDEIRNLISDAPTESLEAQFTKLVIDDIQKQWEMALMKDVADHEDLTPLHCVLTLEVHHPRIFEVLYERFKPIYTDQQKEVWRIVKENKTEMPLTTNGMKDTLLGGAKRKRFKCMRVRPGLGSPVKRKGTMSERCAAEDCLKYKADYYREVQCSNCSRWYHLICVGVRFEEAKFFNNYKCPPCHERNSQASSDHGSSMPSLEPQTELITIE